MIFTITKRFSKNLIKINQNYKSGNLIRFMVTFAEKELSEENRYFKKLDEENKQKLRAKFEKIMSEDGPNKSDVIGLLQSEKDNNDKSFIEKLGIDDWAYALPLAFLVSIPVLQNEVNIMINIYSKFVLSFFINLFYNL